jgi:hypothetical protein
MQSKASTVKEYLASLPDDRRAALEAVRAVILKNLDPAIAEGMSYGMIGYYIPHGIYPPGYHCDPKQPLPFAGLASQKNHMSVYMMSVYGPKAEEFRAAWAKTGKKLDMGACCVRFKKIEDLALDLIGKVIGEDSAADYIARYEASRAAHKPTPRKQIQKKVAARKAAAATAKKPAVKKPAKAKKPAAKKPAR